MYMLICMLNVPPDFDKVTKVDARALISTFPAAGVSGTRGGGGGVYVG